MNRVLDLDFSGRTARVEAGITNLAISAAAGLPAFQNRARHQCYDGNGHDDQGGDSLESGGHESVIVT